MRRTYSILKKKRLYKIWSFGHFARDQSERENMKNLLRAIARPLLAAPFILAGLDAATAPEHHRERAAHLYSLAEKAGLKIELSAAAVDTTTQATGLAMTAAGTALALGKLPRFSAATLAVLHVPLALANNPFWTHEGAERHNSLVNLAGAAGLIGGALIASADRVGKPSLGWLASKKADEIAANIDIRKHAA